MKGLEPRRDTPEILTGLRRPRQTVYKQTRQVEEEDGMNPILVRLHHVEVVGRRQPRGAASDCSSRRPPLLAALATLFLVPVIVLSQPNLTPFQPPGWSDKIVVSTVQGTTTDSGTYGP